MSCIWAETRGSFISSLCNMERVKLRLHKHVERLEAATRFTAADVNDNTQVITVTRTHTPPCLSVRIHSGSGPTAFTRFSLLGSMFSATFEGQNVAPIL